ncbi:MAG: phosphodiesterase [Clostridia bacterium]|nr:phosphodiesterase [Clostridia bacterium]
MKLLIASDIHGSAVYAEQLLYRLKAEGADRLVLLGDVLYHGPRNDLPDGYAPKAVIELLNPLAQKILCVRGNCDTEVDQMVLSFPLLADYAAILDGNRVLYLTHGHIYNEQHLPPVQPGDAVLYGHTHIPVMHTVNGITFINPGSVSIPKAGSTRGYVIYESGHFVRKDLEGHWEAEFAY